VIHRQQQLMLLTMLDNLLHQVKYQPVSVGNASQCMDRYLHQNQDDLLGEDRIYHLH
jgi:hypothetical protein